MTVGDPALQQDTMTCTSVLLFQVKIWWKCWEMII